MVRYALRELFDLMYKEGEPVEMNREYLKDDFNIELSDFEYEKLLEYITVSDDGKWWVSSIKKRITRAEASRENGKKGGAPKGNSNAKKTTQEPNKTTKENNLNNPPYKREIETESKIENEMKCDSPSIFQDESTKKQKADKPDFEGIIALFNNTCILLPQVQKLTQTRKSAINARLKEYSMAAIETVFKKVAENDFFAGVNDRGWQTNFDWIMEPRHFIKILEGVYDKKPNHTAIGPADTSKYTPQRENVAL